MVDDDIDPTNTSEVIWALGTRVDPEISIEILRGMRGGASDPMLHPEKKKRGEYEMSRAIILACKPYSWIKEFPPSTGTSPELARRIKDKWHDLFK